MGLLDFIKRKPPVPTATMRGQEVVINPDTVKRQRRAVRRLWRLHKAINQAKPGMYRNKLIVEWNKRLRLLQANGVPIPERDPEFTAFVQRFRVLSKKLHEGKS